MKNYFLHHTFLGRLYLRSTRLFFACCAIAGSWCLPALLGFEVTPFYDWSMYAYPQLPRDTFEIAVLQISESDVYRPPSALLDHRRMLITYTLPHYTEMERRRDTGAYDTRAARLLRGLFAAGPGKRMHNAAAEFDSYPGWLHRYASQQTGRASGAFGADVCRCVYKRDFRVQTLACKPLFK